MKIPDTLLSWSARFLGMSFMTYGLVKIFGGQFFHGDFTIDSRTTDGTFLVWAFYGYSPIYGRLIGLAEFIPGVLLLFRRTRTLGALILFPVTLNITLMDFCFNFPAVKYVSLVFTILSGTIAMPELPRLLRAIAPPLTPTPLSTRSTWRRYGGGSVLVLLALFLVNCLAVSLTPLPIEPALGQCTRAGWEKDKLHMVRVDLDPGWLLFNRRGFAEFEVTGVVPSKHLRVSVQQITGFTGWQAGDCGPVGPP